MTTSLPSAGGSYVRDPDGRLVRREEPARSNTTSEPPADTPVAVIIPSSKKKG